AAGDRVVNQRDDMHESAFIQGERMQKDHDRIAFVAVVAWRQIAIQIAPLMQRARPDAMVLAMISRVIHDAALDAPADAEDVEFVLALRFLALDDRDGDADER